MYTALWSLYNVCYLDVILSRNNWRHNLQKDKFNDINRPQSSQHLENVLHAKWMWVLIVRLW